MRWIILVGVLSIADLASADDYHETSTKVLQAMDDDKNHPVLPEIASQPVETRRNIYRDAAAEADDCLAFYYSMAVCLQNTIDHPPPGTDKSALNYLAESYKKERKILMFIAQTFTEAGELKKENILATVEADERANSAKMNRDCGNIMLLTEKNKSLMCTALAANPADRLRYWLSLNRK